MKTCPEKTPGGYSVQVRYPGHQQVCVLSLRTRCISRVSMHTCISSLRISISQVYTHTHVSQVSTHVSVYLRFTHTPWGGLLPAGHNRQQERDLHNKIKKNPRDWSIENTKPRTWSVKTRNPEHRITWRPGLTTCLAPFAPTQACGYISQPAQLALHQAPR